jgi:hypothetical protein
MAKKSGRKPKSTPRAASPERAPIDLDDLEASDVEQCTPRLPSIMPNVIVHVNRDKIMLDPELSDDNDFGNFRQIIVC